jgi:hypothetical protein
MTNGSTASLIVLIVLIVVVVGSLLYFLNVFGSSLTGFIGAEGCKSDAQPWNYYENNKLPPFDCCPGLEGCSDGFCRETCNEPAQPGECIVGSGECCDEDGTLRPSTYVCDTSYSTDFGCPWGNGCGADVGIRYSARYCSGFSSTCNGEISNWGSWAVADYCTSGETCSDGDATCNYESDCPGTVPDDDTCTCGVWQDSSCGAGVCDDDQRLQIRYCSPDGCTTETRCVSDSSCEIDETTCTFDTDCGDDGWVDSPTCSDDDSIQLWRTYTCNNPGADNSYCSYSDDVVTRDSCGEDSCETWGSNYCFDDDLYRARECTDAGCEDENGRCTTSTYTSTEKVQECGSLGCSGGVCITEEPEPECAVAFDCGINSWIGSPSCFEGDVWQTYRAYSCITEECAFSDSVQKSAECGIAGCSDGSCN